MRKLLTATIGLLALVAAAAAVVQAASGPRLNGSFYKGNEGPEPYICVNPIGAKGEFTGEHKITVTKSQKGRAKKISGKTVIHITGCIETIEEVSLRGKLTQ